MATAMKINKEKYLAKCKETLAKLEKPEIEYKEAVDKWKADNVVWAKKVIDSKQLEMVISYRGDQIFHAKGKLAETRPKSPEESEFYAKHNVTMYGTAEAIKSLREVIALIEMTEGDTIGISVANKVSQYLK